MSLSRAQQNVVKTIIATGKRKGANRTQLLAALETARVEANYGNPVGGDGTSSGWRQETKSSYPSVDRRNVAGAASRFFDESKGKRNSLRPGALSQAVQRSAYPDRYAQHTKEAAALLRQFGGAAATTTTTGDTVHVTPAKHELVGATDNTEARQALLYQYLQDSHKPDSLVQLAAGLNAAKDDPGTIKTTPQKITRIPGAKVKSAASKAPGRGKVSGQLDETGHLKDFVARAAGYLGKGIVISTGKAGHNRLTTGGRVSEHSTGEAADLGSSANNFAVGGKGGDAIAAAALQAAGKSKAEAWRLARAGGIHNIYFHGANGQRYRAQIIWKAADHYDHVHVGVTRR